MSPPLQPNEFVLELKQVSRSFYDFWFRPRIQAVKQLSFSLKKGEAYALLGPNGSGKSTTLKMIAGLLSPNQGEVKLFDQSPKKASARARMGYLPEDTPLYGYLNAIETLQFFGRLQGLKGEELNLKLQALLRRVGLFEHRLRPVKQFSKGMSRRLGIAQALLSEPEFLILDEPTSGLDPLASREMKNLLHQLKKEGKTLLISTHLLGDIEDLCDRAGILYKGELLVQGSLKELLEKPNKRLTFSIPTLDRASLAELKLWLETRTGEPPLMESAKDSLESFFWRVLSPHLQTPKQ